MMTVIKAGLSGLTNATVYLIGDSGDCLRDTGWARKFSVSRIGIGDVLRRMGLRMVARAEPGPAVQRLKTVTHVNRYGHCLNCSLAQQLLDIECNSGILQIPQLVSNQIKIKTFKSLIDGPDEDWHIS